jgi:hypothetical protein
MTNLQLLNVIVAALFLAVLAAHYAKKQGRDPSRWFFISLFLGGGGSLILLFLLHRFKKWQVQQNRATARSPAPRVMTVSMPSEVHLKRWYYISTDQRQIGPVEFTDLAKVFKEKQCGDESLVWGEGMSEWTKAQEIPELKQLSSSQ